VNFCRPVAGDYAEHLIWNILKSIKDIFQADDELFRPTALNDASSEAVGVIASSSAAASASTSIPDRFTAFHNSAATASSSSSSSSSSAFAAAVVSANTYTSDEREACMSIVTTISELQDEIIADMKAAQNRTNEKQSQSQQQSQQQQQQQEQQQGTNEKPTFSHVFKFLKSVVMLDAFSLASQSPANSVVFNGTRISLGNINTMSGAGGVSGVSGVRGFASSTPTTTTATNLDSSESDDNSAYQQLRGRESPIAAIAEEMTKLLVSARDSGCTARLFYLLQLAESEEETALAEQLLFLIWSKHTSPAVRELMTASKAAITAKDYDGALKTLNQVSDSDGSASFIIAKYL